MEPIAPENDPGAALLARARAGDANAFCTVIEPHQDRLFRQAALLCGDLSTADDLVSETLMEAWKSLSRFDGRCRLSTWLYAILLHRWQKYVRRRRSRPVLFAGLDAAESGRPREGQAGAAAADVSPAELLSQIELARQVNAAIDRLPLEHQQVIRLRFFEDATLPEIAEVLRCPIGTVKSRLHYALDKLRRLPGLRE